MTTMSAVRAAPRLSSPVTLAEAMSALIALAAASALSLAREPSTIRYPAVAQRVASAEPRSPVPPRMAMVARPVTSSPFGERRCLLAVDAAPVADAERHDLDGGQIVVDGHVLVVGMHHRGRARPKDHGRGIAIEVEKTRIGSALPAADLGLPAANLRVVLAYGLNDRMIARDFRSVRVVAYEAHLRRMLLHPRILGSRTRHLIDQTLLHAFVVLSRHRADASLEETAGGKRARIVAG